MASESAGVSMTMLDLFTGGALSNFSVFSLGIMPYITASIIMQLMQGVIPTIGRWAKEGETGRRKITQWTRYLTLILGLIALPFSARLFNSLLNANAHLFGGDRLSLFHVHLFHY